MIFTFSNGSFGYLQAAWVKVCYFRKINPRFVIVSCKLYNFGGLTHQSLFFHSSEEVKWEDFLI